MKKSNKRELPDILTTGEEEKLLGSFNTRYPTSLRGRTMIELALNTGMRIGDLINLRWEDIELSTGRTHIKMGKGRKDRVVFIKPGILSDMLDTAAKMNREPEGLVFTTMKGGAIKDAHLRKMIAERARKAGIEKRVHFHLLRHTYLTNLYTRTKDLRLVQEVAGHASSATTEIYTQISGEDIRAAMLEEAREEKPDAEEMRAVLGAFGARR